MISNERPVIKMSLDGKVIAEFSSVKKAAKSVNAGSGHKGYYLIHSALNGRNKSAIAHGFKWAYKEIKPSKLQTTGPA